MYCVLFCLENDQITHEHTSKENKEMTLQARIQDSEGGGVHSGGGGRTGISGADPSCCRVLGKSSKKKLQTAVRGVSDHPPKNPVSAHALG